MSLHGLGARIERNLSNILSQKLLNSADIIVVQSVPSGSTAGFDPNIESSYPATTLVSGTWPAMVHFVEPLRSGIRQFTEIQAGDVILDFASDAPISGSNAVFIVNEQRYVQKEVGNELAQYWDLMIGGKKLFRTFVATRRP